MTDSVKLIYGFRFFVLFPFYEKIVEGETMTPLLTQNPKSFTFIAIINFAEILTKAPILAVIENF